MTQPEQRAAHEEFLKGITAKMLGICALGILSVCSSFWIGFYKMEHTIDDNRVHADERITAGQNASIKRADSVQRINDLEHKDLWNAIGQNPQEVSYRGVTEYKDKRGKIHLKPSQSLN
jgi:hypothetical protein